MDVADYIREVVNEKLDGDSSRFDELWDLVPGFGKKLRSFDPESSWMHWSPKTFDGWYCIDLTQGYEVYYQEHGLLFETTHFKRENEAVKYALTSAGVLR